MTCIAVQDSVYRNSESVASVFASLERAMSGQVRELRLTAAAGAAANLHR